MAFCGLTRGQYSRVCACFTVEPVGTYKVRCPRQLHLQDDTHTGIFLHVSIPLPAPMPSLTSTNDPSLRLSSRRRCSLSHAKNEPGALRAPELPEQEPLTSTNTSEMLIPDFCFTSIQKGIGQSGHEFSSRLGWWTYDERLIVHLRIQIF